MIYFHEVTRAGTELRAVMEIPKHAVEFFRALLANRTKCQTVCAQGIFSVIAETWLAKTEWAFLTKKGSVIPLLASWSYLCTSDFRP